MKTEHTSENIFVYEDVYSFIDEYNPNNKCKTPIIFDDMILGMLISKVLNQLLNQLVEVEN